MNVWVPWTEVQPATEVALLHVTHQRAWVGRSDTAYVEFLEGRWAEQRAFINVEHDVVFWPGALMAMWLCPEPWCAYGYHETDTFDDQRLTLFPYMGCTKFGADLILATPDLWAEKPDRTWQDCDGHLARYARARGFDVHQHFPSVVNANPLLLRRP